jgi:4-amino-4-deoxy-L-arabinose transferase-like glycosyltransferase
LRKPHLYALLLAAALIFFAPIRVGDLPGYDDALFAHIAKGIAQSGGWLRLTSNGYPALEHPPLFDWILAALFRGFGISDPVAKFPAALAAFGCLLLVYWLSRRLLGDALGALVSVFVLATTAYFIKYASHAMTDVPFTFFFLAAVCCWVQSEQDERWLLAAGVFTACAQMTRGFAGLALVILFVTHAALARRRVSIPYASASLAIAFLPITLWYAYWIHRYGDYFFEVHRGWMEREVYGALSPPWRRYTGLFEYLWMISKSYWPWLPAMIAGLIVAWRNPKLRVLPLWIAAMLVLCAATKSRVLRYMLPAYPAFSILAAVGIRAFIPERRVAQGLKVLIPAMCVVAIAVAIRPPRADHAGEIREITALTRSAAPENERIAFYDQGQPRYDEINQLQWYGNHNLTSLLDRAAFEHFLAQRPDTVFIVDQDAYRQDIEGKLPNQVLGRAGHLVCGRLLGGEAQLHADAR